MTVGIGGVMPQKFNEGRVLCAQGGGTSGDVVASISSLVRGFALI
jgi:hypothetical protein